MHKPLEGVRVLEWGIFHAGPGGSAILCDMGAEVIRIEEPRGGIDRTYTLLGPDGETLTFKAIARGKKSITLRLNTETGQDIFRELVKHSDIVLHNYVPGSNEA